MFNSLKPCNAHSSSAPGNPAVTIESPDELILESPDLFGDVPSPTNGDEHDIEVEASHVGAGAVLMQNDEQEIDRAGFFLKKFNRCV